MQRDISRWKGLMTSPDPKDIPADYSVIQRNIGSFRPGRLDVRGGLHLLTDLLANISAADTEEKIGIFGHSAPHAKWLLSHRTDGSIKAYRNTSAGNVVPLVPSSDAFDTDYPCSMVRDGLGGVLIFNGLQRGYRWDGTLIGATASAHEVGVESPEDVASTTSQPPSVATNGLTGPTEDGAYIFGYRYRDRWGNLGNLSETADLVSTGGAGFTWSGLIASDQSVNSQYRVQYIELLRSVADVPNAMYLVARIGNRGTVVSASGNGTTTTLVLEAGHNLVVGAVIAITGVTGLTTLEIATVTTTGATGLSAYNSTDSDGGAWTLAGYVADNYTDIQLEARNIDDQTSLLFEDNTINARSYGLPPDDKPFYASYNGIMFAYGRVNYSIGTATGSTGNSTVTLSAGTKPKTEWAGRKFIVTSTGVEYDIVSVNEGTRVLTLDRKLTGDLTAVDYVVTPSFTRANLLCFSRPGQQEGFLETDAIRVQLGSDSNDLETGLIQFGPYLYVMHEYHTYQVTCNSDARYDAQVTLASYRGMANNRSWALDQGTAYIFDQKGGYSIEGPCCPKDLTSLLMKDIFDNDVDWTDAKKKWYFASVDPATRVVRYHVNYTGDSATYPKRAVCFNVLTGQWWTETYPFEICGAAEYEVNGRLRLVFAGPDDKYLVMGLRGTGDGIQTPVQGTAATYVGSTLTASSSVFTAAMVSVPIKIVTGTGAGAYATGTYASGTTMTIASASSDWSIDTTSVFVVGAIEAEIKTGMLNIVPPQAEDGKTVPQAVAREIRMSFDPTTYDNRIAMSLYLNSESSPLTPGQNYENRGIRWTANSPYCVMTSSKTQNVKGEDPGVRIVSVDKVVSDKGISDRYLSVDVNLVQGVSPLTMRSLELTGVA